jgi:CRP/FNR family cyclic AMP-dependent transcriptional regulator
VKERFEGAGLPNLVAALRRQEFAGGDSRIVEALVKHGVLVEFNGGDKIIVQADEGNEIFLLIAGSVAVVANGAQVATRLAGQFVGEMAAIEPALARSASVAATEKTVALKLNSADFMRIGEEFPQIWLPIARELSRRLFQRNTMIPLPNEAPKLFLMSSSEAIEVADALRAGMEKDVFSTVWKEGVFFAGGYPLEALEMQVNQSDFAVAVAEPDDIVETRGTKQRTMRDNVLFELGLFMGKLTRYRTILVHPRVKDLKLPSDLQGLTLVSYEVGTSADVTARIAPACEEIRKVVHNLGVRTFTP